MTTNRERLRLWDLEVDAAAVVLDAFDGRMGSVVRGPGGAELLPGAGAAALDVDVDLFVDEILVDVAVRDLADDPLRVADRVDLIAAAVERGARGDDDVRDDVVRERPLRAEVGSRCAITLRLRNTCIRCGRA